MKSWNFKTQIFSGPSSLDRLEQIKSEKLLIICDPFLKGSANLDTVLAKLDASNSVEIYTEVIPDPPISHIVKGVEFMKIIQPNMVIVIGGGSAIDMAKGICYFAHKLYQLEIEKFIAIPTTSGTGSEVTSFAVITDSQSGIKYPLVDDALLPDEAILTTLFVKTAPASVTAYSGMDVLVHALEALVAKEATNFTDALAEKAIELVFDHLITCVHQGDNEASRSAMHEASTLAGLAFNSAGLGITHALAHQLGGQFHIPHGLANSMLLPYVIGYNAANSEKAYAKYTAIARKLGLTRSEDKSEQLVALVTATKILAREVGCKSTVGEWGIAREEVMQKMALLVKAAREDMTYAGNPYEAPSEDLMSILQFIL